ncbi:RRP4 [Lepeophtheirus salmonis]|uniref:RRP4 n=1 Tax=Lepeophtheirus salmonis TaxID=72036 RepID=A0A7R8H8W0_LEPSM|nr:RRP4 [Lepeophtheirus salmonis]CAF2948761.1 RRP4 [Lepeophtheirus salmonis]
MILRPSKLGLVDLNNSYHIVLRLDFPLKLEITKESYQDKLLNTISIPDGRITIVVLTMDISLANEWEKPPEDVDEATTFVTPGDIITRESGYMRGHGTYASDEGNEEKECLIASVGGVVKRVNKLIRVLPLRSTYQGEIGDVLVGRIVEVQQKRWKVEVNSRLDAILHLSSVNLSLGEGDLISAEVQTLYKDGSMSIHTRSLKYGKLEGGTVVKVSPSLIKRQKDPFPHVPWSIKSMISISEEDDDYEKQEYENGSNSFDDSDLGLIESNPRLAIARLRNVVLALAANGVQLWDTSIIYGFKASENYDPKSLLKRDVMYDVARKTQLRLESDNH